MTNSPNHTPGSGTPPADTRRSRAGDPPAESRQLAVLLVCFSERRAASKARRSLEMSLRASGDAVLETTVLNVDAEHKAAVHDPRRVIAGALTPTLTWGIFGLATGGVASLLVSAVLGAALGGYYAYHSVHHTTAAQLTRLGAQLPAPSSALMIFVETADPQRLLEPTTQPSPSTASVVVIGDDLASQAIASSPTTPSDAVPNTSHQPLADEPLSRLSMIVLRYLGAGTARTVTAGIGRLQAAPEIELVVETDRSGHTRVTDPKFGSAAFGKNNVVSWGGLGLVCGALAGLTGGQGIVGFLAGGIITAIVWALFGLGAGALYGLWAGRAISARRLKPIRGLLVPDTSALVAWTDQPLTESVRQVLTPGGARQLILTFKPTAHGALLEAF